MSRLVTALGGPDAKEDCISAVTTFSLELPISGESVEFEVKVADTQARLSDIAPLARAISSKLEMATLDRLAARGECVSCRRGCSACCSYLVPLSVPEAFRMAEELRIMPASESRTLMQSSLDTARTILDRMPRDLDKYDSATASDSARPEKLSDWYAGLGLACPFLSTGACVLYDQRPIACREYMVTSSPSSCYVVNAGEPDVVEMPVSIVECLGQLTAELEQSDLEAIMLPLALPWAQENMERSRRKWPAVAMVERFVEILQVTAESSTSAAVATQAGGR